MTRDTKPIDPALNAVQSATEFAMNKSPKKKKSTSKSTKTTNPRKEMKNEKVKSALAQGEAKPDGEFTFFTLKGEDASGGVIHGLDLFKAAPAGLVRPGEEDGLEEYEGEAASRKDALVWAAHVMKAYPGARVRLEKVEGGRLTISAAEVRNFKLPSSME